MNWKRTLILGFGGGALLVGTALWLSLNTPERQIQALEIRVIELQHPLERPPPIREEALWRDILAGRLRLLGPDHIDTLESRKGVADSLRDQKKYKDAEAEYRVLLAAEVRNHGADSVQVRYTRFSLAAVLEDQGRYAEAEVERRALLEGALATKAEVWPGVRPCRYNLVQNLDHQKKYEEVEVELREQLKLDEERDRLHGDRHGKWSPYRFETYSNLADCLRKQGRLEEAKDYARRAYQGAKDWYGVKVTITLQFEKKWLEIKDAEE